MGPVEKRQLTPVIFLCHGLVRHQHKILYDLRSIVSLIWPYIDRLPVFIQYHFRLREVKINGASPATALPQDIG